MNQRRKLNYSKKLRVIVHADFEMFETFIRSRTTNWSIAFFWPSFWERLIKDLKISRSFFKDEKIITQWNLTRRFKLSLSRIQLQLKSFLNGSNKKIKKWAVELEHNETCQLERVHFFINSNTILLNQKSKNYLHCSKLFIRRMATQSNKVVVETAQTNQKLLHLSAISLIH